MTHNTELSQLIVVVVCQIVVILVLALRERVRAPA